MLEGLAPMTNRSTQRLARSSAHSRNPLVFPMFALHVVACGRFRQKEAEAKQSAAKAKNPSMKREFEEVAAGWRVLAEQVEWIDRERERKTGPDEPS
jgi:hypothetical protein